MSPTLPQTDLTHPPCYIFPQATPAPSEPLNSLLQHHLDFQRAPERPCGLHQKEEGETLDFIMQGRGDPSRRSEPSLIPISVHMNL
jgi:hypothetical protein